MPFQGGNKNFRPGSSDRGSGPPPSSGSGGGGGGGGAVMGGPRPGVPSGGANFQPMGNGSHTNKWANHGARGLQSGPPGKAR